MTSKLIKSALLGGLVAFLWVSLSWMVLPWHKNTIGYFKDDEAVRACLLENISSMDKAVYSLPSMHQGKKDAGGPRALIALSPKGGKFSPIKLLKEFGLDAVVSLLIAYLLLQSKANSYKARLGLIAVIALALSLWANLPDSNWWGFANNYIAIGILDSFITVMLAGLVIAKFAKN